MAEAIGIASGLIGIADMGFKLTTALYRFAKTYSTADSEVEGIANTISVTATILVTLGELIQDDPRDLNKLKRWATVPNTIAMCQKDFERIQNALGLAKAGTLPAQTNAPSRGKAVSLSPWQKIQLAIGGIEELDKLLLQLERSKSNLELVLGVVNYDTLRDLRKSNQMSPDLTQQWEEMKAILPWLVANLKMLQGQGTRPSNESAHREPAPAATAVIQNPYPAPPPVMLTARPLTSSRHSLDSETQPFGGESPQDPNRTPAPRGHNRATEARPFYQIWRLRYQRQIQTVTRSSIRGRNGYQMSMKHTPLSVTLMPVSIKPAGYVFTNLKALTRPDLVKEIADKKKGHPPFHEMEARLPPLALAAINKLVTRHDYMPEVELIVLDKPSIWDRLTRRHKQTPSFTVYLSFNLLQSGGWSRLDYGPRGGSHVTSDSSSIEDHEDWMPPRTIFPEPNMKTTMVRVPSPSLPTEKEAEKFMDDFLDRLNESEEEKAKDEEEEVEVEE